MYAKYFNCLMDGKNMKLNAKSIDVNLSIEYQDANSPIFTEELSLQKIPPPKITIELMYKNTFMEKKLGDRMSIIALFATGTEDRVYVPYIISAFGTLTGFRPEKFDTTTKKMQPTAIVCTAEYYKSYSMTGSGIEIDRLNNTFVNKSGDLLAKTRNSIKL